MVSKAGVSRGLRKLRDGDSLVAKDVRKRIFSFRLGRLAGLNLLAYGSYRYTYDAKNQLVEVQTAGYSVLATFRYDPQGRRTLKISGGSTTRYVYQGWNLIAELNTSYAISKKYHWGLDATGTLQGAGGVGGLLMIEDGGNKYYPVYDGQHNIIGLHNASGGIAAWYQYGAYGELLASGGSAASVNPFRFSTKYTDHEIGPGLIYYGLRYYHAKLGRFINRDPIAEAGGLNLYGFVTNDPINYYDYLGMSEDDGYIELPKVVVEGDPFAGDDAIQDFIDDMNSASDSGGGQYDPLKSDLNPGYGNASLDTSISREVKVAVAMQTIRQFMENLLDPGTWKKNSSRKEIVENQNIKNILKSIDELMLKSRKIRAAWKDAQRFGWEYGGLIYTEDGKTVKTTKGITQECSGKVNPWLAQTKHDLVPGGAQVSATWHIHLQGPIFSGGGEGRGDVQGILDDRSLFEAIGGYVVGPGGEVSYWHGSMQVGDSVTVGEIADRQIYIGDIKTN